MRCDPHDRKTTSATHN